MNCSICCEKFNKSTHAKVICKTCEDDTIISCRTCCKKYLTENESNPSCMICKVDWDHEFLTNYFTKKFINHELKEIKKNVLLEKEIAKLPETQEYAQAVKLKEGLRTQLELLAREKFTLTTRIAIINKNQQDICASIVTIDSALYNGTIGLDTNTFSCKCPFDSCKGFLDKQYNCGICQNQICKKCMEIKEEEHECNTDKVKTITLLKKDTKPCPKCGQLIFKIDGCDQMWCPPCHTPFSWRTGQVETGKIHNPEYYRWVRETSVVPRDPQDQLYNPCGDVIPNYNVLILLMRKHYPYKSLNNVRIGSDTFETYIISGMHKLINHIEMLNNNNIREIQFDESKKRDLRVQYLLNQITKDSWKNKLQIIDKKHEKKTSFINVWNLLNIVLVEYIGKIMETRENDNFKIVIKEIISESNTILQFCNKSFKKIGKMYSCVFPGVGAYWVQVDNYRDYVKEK